VVELSGVEGQVEVHRGMQQIGGHTNRPRPRTPAPLLHANLFAGVLREQLLQLRHHGPPDVHLLSRVGDAGDGLAAAARRRGSSRS